MTVIYVIAAFLGGVLFQRFMSALAIIFSMKNYALHVVENEILAFVLNVYSRLIMSLETGYITMRAAGVSEETIKRIKNEDDHDLLSWKKEVVQKFVESYPEVYKDNLGFDSWEGAMQQLTAYKDAQREKKNETTT
jgi:hypothetical protein